MKAKGLEKITPVHQDIRVLKAARGVPSGSIAYP